jgi:hypothetical protein
MWHALMRPRRIKKPVTAHGLRGSLRGVGPYGPEAGFNKDLKSPTSKLNETLLFSH